MMLSVLKFFLFGTLLIGFVACGKKDMGQYAHYLKDAESGLTQQQNRSGITYAATYEPIDFVVGRSLNPSERTKKGLEQARLAYLGLQYLNLDIYTEGAIAGQNALKQQLEKRGGTTDLTATMTYFQFNMPPDLLLIAGQDTLPCAFAHLEQTGSWGNRMRFLLGFKDDKQRQKPNFSDDLKLCFIDRQLSRDTLHFNFSKTNLNRTPDLTF